MKSLKVASIAFGLCLLTQGMAAETAAKNTSTAAPKGIFQKLKDSPVSLSTLTIISPKLKNQNIKGYNFSNRVYLGYKLTKKDSIKMENRWNTSKSHVKPTKTTHDRITLSYKRSGILNQKDHGINLSAGIAKKINASNEARVSKNSNGTTGFNISVSRDFGNGFSIANYFSYSSNDRRDKKTKGTVTSGIYNAFSQAYQFSDDLSFSLSQELSLDSKNGSGTYDEDGDRVDNGASLGLEVAVGYQLIPEIATSLAAGTTLMNSHDGEFFVSHLGDSMYYYATMYVSAF